MNHRGCPLVNLVYCVCAMCTFLPLYLLVDRAVLDFIVHFVSCLCLHFKESCCCDEGNWDEDEQYTWVTPPPTHARTHTHAHTLPRPIMSVWGREKMAQTLKTERRQYEMKICVYFLLHSVYMSSCMRLHSVAVSDLTFSLVAHWCQH